MKQNKNKALAPQSYEEKIAEAENLRLEAIAQGQKESMENPMVKNIMSAMIKENFLELSRSKLNINIDNSFESVSISYQGHIDGVHPTLQSYVSSQLKVTLDKVLIYEEFYSIDCVFEYFSITLLNKYGDTKKVVLTIEDKKIGQDFIKMKEKSGFTVISYSSDCGEEAINLINAITDL